MFPTFKWSVFRSPLYSLRFSESHTVLAHDDWGVLWQSSTWQASLTVLPPTSEILPDCSRLDPSFVWEQIFRDLLSSREKIPARESGKVLTPPATKIDFKFKCWITFSHNVYCFVFNFDHLKLGITFSHHVNCWVFNFDHLKQGLLIFSFML